MKRLLNSLAVLVLHVPSLAIAGEPTVNRSELDVGDGIIATSDGRPGSLMKRLIHATEDDLSDVAVRTVDVIYGRKYGTALTMDIYQPKRKPNRVGIIHIVSGGLWSGPEYRRMPYSTSNIRPLLEIGYTVFAVMHSSQPKFTLLEIRDDVPRSVRYIRHHAHRFGIRPDRIGVMGFSSGGHLALLAATTAGDGKSNADDPVDAESSRGQAVVAYFPNSDLLNYGEVGKLMSEHFREQGLKMDAAFDFQKWEEGRCIFAPMTEQEVRGVFHKTSPLTHVSRDDAPTLLFHGDEDKLVPMQQSQEFVRRMKQAGAICELVVAEGEGHAWQEPFTGERARIAEWYDRYLAPSVKKAQWK
jgi:acetyl esterase/lipase